MNQSSRKILQYLSGNENLTEVTVEDLQKQVEEHPYFAVGQFLLAKKLKAEDNPGFLQQAQKTALFFSNPYWLHYQLTDEQLGVLSQPKEEVAVETRDTDPATDDFLKQLAEPGETIADETIEPSDAEPGTISIKEETPEVDEAMTREAEISETTTAFLREVETPVVEETAEPVIKPQILPKEEDSSSGPDDTSQHKKPESVEPDEHEQMFQNIKAMLDATSEEADADTKSTVVPIDPYYTIDYFASQGIKLELDQNPQDQLGKQVKKFTQWLRHMKKLGPEDATEVINRNTEADEEIQQIADSSNTVREVVTEAMALVLEKQGKKDKAIELYNKLSFLNPHKRTYFADKIKNLKGI